MALSLNLSKGDEPFIRSNRMLSSNNFIISCVGRLEVNHHPSKVNYAGANPVRRSQLEDRSYVSYVAPFV